MSWICNTDLVVSAAHGSFCQKNWAFKLSIEPQDSLKSPSSSRTDIQNLWQEVLIITTKSRMTRIANFKWLSFIPFLWLVRFWAAEKFSLSDWSIEKRLSDKLPHGLWVTLFGGIFIVCNVKLLGMFYFGFIFDSWSIIYSFFGPILD